jgi:hypothetical protein
MPAKSVFESFGSIDIMEQPVDGFAPARIFVHVRPPSVVR